MGQQQQEHDETKVRQLLALCPRLEHTKRARWPNILRYRVTSAEMERLKGAGLLTGNIVKSKAVACRHCSGSDLSCPVPCLLRSASYLVTNT